MQAADRLRELSNIALVHAAIGDIASATSRSLPTFFTSDDEPAMNGDDRFDSLLAKYGRQIHYHESLSDWARIEETIAAFASELRFRVFARHDDAVRAGANIVDAYLFDAGYRRLKDGFVKEFERLLSQRSEPSKPLVKCIRSFFKRPESR